MIRTLFRFPIAVYKKYAGLSLGVKILIFLAAGITAGIIFGEKA